MAKILFSLVGERHRLTSDLVEGELLAIGQFTVAWGTFEHLMFAQTYELCEKAKIPLPPAARSLSFKKRRRAWLAVIKACTRKGKKREQLEAIAKLAGSIERSRHRIIHGVWDWREGDPERITSSGFKPPHGFEEHFDFEKLMKLAERVEGLNFQLTYPGGKKQAEAEHVRSLSKHGGYFSRRALLMMMEKPPQHFLFFQPKPVKADPFLPGDTKPDGASNPPKRTRKRVE